MVRILWYWLFTAWRWMKLWYSTFWNAPHMRDVSLRQMVKVQPVTLTSSIKIFKWNYQKYTSLFAKSPDVVTTSEVNLLERLHEKPTTVTHSVTERHIVFTTNVQRHWLKMKLEPVRWIKRQSLENNMLRVEHHHKPCKHNHHYPSEHNHRPASFQYAITCKVHEKPSRKSSGQYDRRCAQTSTFQSVFCRESPAAHKGKDTCPG